MNKAPRSIWATAITCRLACVPPKMADQPKRCGDDQAAEDSNRPDVRVDAPLVPGPGKRGDGYFDEQTRRPLKQKQSHEDPVGADRDGVRVLAVEFVRSCRHRGRHIFEGRHSEQSSFSARQLAWKSPHPKVGLSASMRLSRPARQALSASTPPQFPRSPRRGVMPP